MKRARSGRHMPPMELVRAVRARRFGLVRPAASALLHVGASAAGEGYRCASQAHPHAGGRVALPPAVTVDGVADRAARRPLGRGALRDRKGRKERGWAQGAAPGNNPALRLRGTKEAVLRSLPRSGNALREGTQRRGLCGGCSWRLRSGSLGRCTNQRRKLAVRSTVAMLSPLGSVNAWAKSNGPHR